MKKYRVLTITILIAILLTMSGCFSGTGFDKKTTLMPNRVGLSYGQQRYKTDDADWRGFTINAQWDLE